MNLTVEKILEMKNAGELFTSPDNIKEEFKALARHWHPDKIEGNAEVMTHINKLYREGLDLIKEGKWIRPNFLKIGNRELNYLTSFSFELGDVYVGNSYIAFIIDKKHGELYNNAIKYITSFTFPNEEMKKEISKYLPVILDKFETSDKLALVIKKTSDCFPLRYILNYHSGLIPDKHVAWIQSRLQNIVCYLEYLNLSHNAINIDTCFISPQYHTILLLGGWWYAVPYGNKMLGMPSINYSILPPKIKSNKTGNLSTDLESIRALGRELLGDRNGMSLSIKKIAPEPMILYLKGASSETAIKDFQLWDKALTESYGKRKFIEMPVNADVLYKK